MSTSIIRPFYCFLVLLFILSNTVQAQEKSSTQTANASSSGFQTNKSEASAPVVVTQTVNTTPPASSTSGSSGGSSGATKFGWTPFYEIEVDLLKGSISPPYLPFDAPFVLKGKVPKEVKEVEVRYVEEKYYSKCEHEIDYCDNCYSSVTCFNVVELLDKAKKKVKAVKDKQSQMKKMKKKIENTERQIQEVKKKIEAQEGEIQEVKNKLNEEAENQSEDQNKKEENQERQLQVEKDKVEALERFQQERKKKMEELELEIIKEKEQLKDEKKKNLDCKINLLEKIEKHCECGATWIKSEYLKAKKQDKNEFRVAVPALEANKRYRFFIRMVSEKSHKEVKSLLKVYQNDLSNLIQDLSKKYDPKIPIEKINEADLELKFSEIYQSSGLKETKNLVQTLEGEIFTNDDKKVYRYADIFKPQEINTTDLKRLLNLFRMTSNNYEEKLNPLDKKISSTNSFFKNSIRGNQLLIDLGYVLRFEREKFKNNAEGLKQLEELISIYFENKPKGHDIHVISGRSPFNNFRKILPKLKNNDDKLLVDTTILNAYIVNIDSFISFLGKRIDFLVDIYSNGKHANVFEQFFLYDTSLIAPRENWKKLNEDIKWSDSLILHYIELEKCIRDSQLNCSKALLSAFGNDSLFDKIDEQRKVLKKLIDAEWDKKIKLQKEYVGKQIHYDTIRMGVNERFLYLVYHISELRDSLLVRYNTFIDYKKSIIAFEKELGKVTEKTTKGMNWRIIKQHINNIPGLTSHTYSTRINWYVSGDVGISHIPFGNDFSDGMALHAATNFNLCPINREVRYGFLSSSKRYGTGKALLKNTSVIIGVTLNNDDLVEDGRKALWKVGNPMVGAGLRITDGVRVNTGVVMFQKKDDRPLVEDYDLKAYWFWGLSFDLDVGSALGFLGKTLFPNAIK